MCFCLLERGVIRYLEARFGISFVEARESLVAKWRYEGKAGELAQRSTRCQFTPPLRCFGAGYHERVSKSIGNP
jgi:hypothetical protein